MPVNRKEIDALIEFMKFNGEKKFNMNDYIMPQNSCGTAACIAGEYMIMTCLREHTRPTVAALRAHANNAAAGGLGLTQEQANYLFTPLRRECGYLRLGNIPLSDAIATLEHLRDTGEVKWPKGER